MATSNVSGKDPSAYDYKFHESVDKELKSLSGRHLRVVSCGEGKDQTYTFKVDSTFGKFLRNIGLLEKKGDYITNKKDFLSILKKTSNDPNNAKMGKLVLKHILKEFKPDTEGEKNKLMKSFEKLYGTEKFFGKIDFKSRTSPYKLLERAGALNGDSTKLRNYVAKQILAGNTKDQSLDPIVSLVKFSPLVTEVKKDLYKEVAESKKTDPLTQALVDYINNSGIKEDQKFDKLLEFGFDYTKKKINNIEKFSEDLTKELFPNDEDRQKVVRAKVKKDCLEFGLQKIGLETSSTSPSFNHLFNKYSYLTDNECRKGLDNLNKIQLETSSKEEKAKKQLQQIITDFPWSTDALKAAKLDENDDIKNLDNVVKLEQKLIRQSLFENTQYDDPELAQQAQTAINDFNTKITLQDPQKINRELQTKLDRIKDSSRTEAFLARILDGINDPKMRLLVEQQARGRWKLDKK